MSLSLSTPSLGNKPRIFKVLCPIERKDGATHWIRVGSAFANKDESLNLYLDVLPANLKLQVRELDEEDLQPRGRRREGADGPKASGEPLPF